MKFIISESAGRNQAWFDNLSHKEQKAYLESHPNSKFGKKTAKTAKPAAKTAKPAAKKKFTLADFKKTQVGPVFKTAKSLNDHYGPGTSDKFVKSGGHFYLNSDVHKANRSAAKKVLSEGLGINFGPDDHQDLSMTRNASGFEQFAHRLAKARGVDLPKDLPKKFAHTMIHGVGKDSKSSKDVKPDPKMQAFKNKLDALRQKLTTAKPEDIAKIRLQISKVRDQIAATK